MDSLSEGQVLTGKVKNITDYGVFVDLGGLDGLLHITDLSWARVKHPNEVVATDQEIEVQILKFDKEKMRGSLGRKQLLPDPWATVPQRYPAGTKTRGKVVGIADYGAFVELETGVEGLVHITEMSWSKRMQHPSKLVKTGDEVDVLVLDVKPDQRRVSLGMKQAQPDPWQTLAEKYPVGTIVTGKVRNLTEFGAFVELAEGIEGLCHISEIEDKRHKGDSAGKPFGHGPGGAGVKAGAQLEAGKEYDFKIIKVSREQHKIGLSYRAAVKQAERRDMDEYRSSKSSPTATIGDAILSKRESL